MTTIKEIAEKAGYSSATVSRLLNNDPALSITADTKNKILEIAHQLGYWRDHPIKNIKPTLALLYRVIDSEQLQDQYFTELKNQIKEIAKEQKIPLKTYYSFHSLIKDASLYQGFIGIGINHINTKRLNKLHQVLPNGVFIDANPAPKLFDSIKPNLALTVEDAVAQLVKNGYQHIGFIGGEGFNFNGIQERDEREIAFEEYVRSHHIANTLVFIGGKFSVDTGYSLGKRVLKECKNNFPDAFVIASDTLSVGVLQAFNEANISIPEQAAIISINNSQIAKYVSPPLTSYNIDQKEMAETALQMLVQLIINPKRPHLETKMNTNLVFRKSFVPKK